MELASWNAQKELARAAGHAILKVLTALSTLTMTKHHRIAAEIHRLIRSQGLQPGEAMPSERELAAQFRVSYGVVRLANDFLCREGVIERRHGSGTYVAASTRAQLRKQRRHRLGLLYVDLPTKVTTYSQALTFGLQREAQKAGYEVLIEEMDTEMLVQGKLPEMIRRNSVDAVVLDGPVREHHIRFLEDQNVLYVVVGTCPLGARVPQVRINGARLGFEITRELLQAGRSPVWLDVDLTRTDYWHFGLEMFRGYSDAVQRFGDGKHSLHLCPLHANQVAGAAAKLVQAGLKNAAIIAQDWGAALLPAALALKSPTPDDLLLVPLPWGVTTRHFTGGNVASWTSLLETEELSEQVVRSLVDVIEGREEQFASLSLEMTCQIVQNKPGLKLDMRREWKRGDRFVIEQHGRRQSWRHLDAGKDETKELLRETAPAILN